MTQDNDTAAAEAPAPEELAAASPEAPVGPSIEERFAQLEADLATARKDVLYAKAEVENVRRRMEAQIEDRGKYAVANFAKDVVNVADNLRRALDSLPPEAREGGDLAKTLVVGVEMTERELLVTMERYGIRPVPAKGERFDPNVHQAMMEVEDTTVPAGTVVMVMQGGYVIHDRLLRPAMVGVSKGGPKVQHGEQVDTNA